MASSVAFRSAVSQLSKDETPPFAGLFIANSVTLSTRVRIEILRAISNVLTTDETESFVQSFTSRPILHYYTREGVNHAISGANRTYTFVEAVDKFGALVPPSGLVKAYRRARPAFNGCMEQYFVVLKEAGPQLPPEPPTQGPNSFPLGTRGSYVGRGVSFSRPRRGRDGPPSRSRGASRGARGTPQWPAVARGQRGQRDLRKRPNDEDSATLSTPSKRSVQDHSSSQARVSPVTAPEPTGDHAGDSDQTLMFVDANSSL